MLILTNPGTADKIELVTSAAVTVDVHASYVDHTTSTDNVVAGRTNTAVTTATTTTIVAGPASGDIRNVKTLHIRNKHASTSVDVTVQVDQGGTDYELFKVTLAAGNTLEFVEGVGFFVVSTTTAVTSTNKSTTSQAFSTTDAYIVGSALPLAGLGTPAVGYMYDCSFDMAKTAGTGAMVVTLRVGTAGTTADTARLTFTMDAGTSVADTAVFVVRAMFRAVGASAVLQGRLMMVNSGPTATGFRDGSPTLGVLQVTSAAFDATVANSIVGLSFNGSTAFAGTAQLVEAEWVRR
jgi:hypothetical protein